MVTQKIINKVQESKNYSTFKFLTFNRDVDNIRVKKLEESMTQFGFTVPIIISHKSFILDGQHRLKAAKNLRIPIKFYRYKIDDKKIPLFIGLINTTSKTWKIIDFFYMWYKLGVRDYRWIKRLSNQHDIGINLILTRVMKLGGGDGRLGNLKNGTLSLAPVAKKMLETRCNRINEIFYYDKEFVNFSCRHCNCSCGYDKKL